jgi:hypothetical protein
LTSTLLAAMSSALITNEERMWSAIDQPTTRLNGSRLTVARYSQPSHVEM